jgi:hypothetical protein
LISDLKEKQLLFSRNLHIPFITWSGRRLPSPNAAGYLQYLQYLQLLQGISPGVDSFRMRLSLSSCCNRGAN